MIECLLIANRGEIACRVAATARRLGIRTVAIYSRADAHAQHVRACDAAWALDATDDRRAYLDGARIIELAQRSGAQAIHPGYGFLSENAEFAQACADAGLIFIGPPPAAIRAMGLKAESKRLMAQAGVPLIPGYHEPDQDPLRLALEAGRIGFPLLIKASAGGGGKGMRIVPSAPEFEALLAACQREAAASFGNPAVILERYATRPRHVEVQVFGDALGQIIYLGDRDCSVQRRHQKVIEEAPAPGLPASTRQAMGEAAVAAARAVGYVGAGTVEFILDDTGAFYFMEMNTRLQVEHPVTEMITGQDLVEWQLRIAEGEPLPLNQADLALRGHAIEARLYAENPERDFLPATGTLRHLALPACTTFAVRAPGTDEPAAVRIDSGVTQGDAITARYDPMIAKLIVWGPDRPQAIARMRTALAHCEVIGLQTNIDFIARLMRCESFVSADLDTALITREAAALAPPATAPAALLACAAAAWLARATTAPDSPDPWSITDAFRVTGAHTHTLRLAHREQLTAVQIIRHRAETWLALDEQRAALSSVTLTDGHLSAQWGETQLAARVIFEDTILHIYDGTQHWVLSPVQDAGRLAEAEHMSDRLTAPMPGTLTAVNVQAGDTVQAGQTLLVMEAMKMELAITAPQAGRIAEFPYRVHDTVAEGATLVVFAPPDAPQAP